MPKNSRKWSIEEQQTLRKLKNQQIEKNQVNWDEIADRMNLIFNSNKSGKQCRQRYVNYLKFEQNTGINQNWNQDEIDLLIQLYLQKGPKWSEICTYFKNKSQSSVKNKFNSHIRRIAKVLTSHKAKIAIKYQILSGILELSNQILQMGKVLNITVRKESQLFRLREILVCKSLKPQKLKQEQIDDLIELIQLITRKLRCFGVFKIKNKKQWKVSIKNIFAINKFDKIIQKDQKEGKTNNLITNQQKAIKSNIKISSTKIQQNIEISAAYNQIAQQSFNIERLEFDLAEKQSQKKYISLQEQANKILGVISHYTLQSFDNDLYLYL